ncbi:MAG: phosphoglycerate kinase, partial [Spirochaetales bacterium]
MKIKTLDDFQFAQKRVLLRVDINSPIDPQSKKIVNENRIKKSLPTINKLLNGGAKLAIIAHQDDVCGPAALTAYNDLNYGEALIMGNLRYLTEEISTFENDVKLTPEAMQDCYLIRSLKGQFDLYVNEAFAAAHRNAPSMVAFQEFLPACAGDLFVAEVSNLDKILKSPDKPSVFALGGAKISDAFGMMNQVLENGTADKIICSGITG